MQKTLDKTILICYSVTVNERKELQMSLTKRALPENIDLTDPRDTGEYGEPEQLEPTASEWAMVDLSNAVKMLQDHKHELTIGDLQDLTAEVEKLNGLIQHINKPF